MTLLTKRDVAARLRVSTATIDRLCRARALPFSLVGSRRRFSPQAVDDFVASRSFGHLNLLSHEE